MCGIAGVVNGPSAQVGSMLMRMRHRGPDAEAVMEVPGLPVTIGHVRLSIIDLDPRSNQPFASPCGRYLISFNGEIYNYRELRHTLEVDGCTFRTESDTEVLLHWLIRHGTAGLTTLDGMFAFAFVDTTRRSLLLARDQIGEKPLYYSHDKELARHGFAFASELPALLQMPWIDKSLDREALADYLRFLYTAAPHTLYTGIRELRPGHYLELDLDRMSAETRAYYRLEDQVTEPLGGSYEEMVDVFREAFMKSVSLRLRSDVPLGIYLSGGLDSNAILGSAVRGSGMQAVDTFTISYESSRGAKEYDESALASHAAEYWKVKNTRVVYDEHYPFLESINRIVTMFGQPFGNATALVAEQMAQTVAKTHTVCLVGDGGDEIAAGYPRYRALPLYTRMQALPSWLRALMAQSAQVLPEKGILATRARRVRQFLQELNNPLSEACLNWVTYLNSAELHRALDCETETAFYVSLGELFVRNQDNPLRAAALVDLKSFVPYNLMQTADRTSMTHSLELRCPYLATNLIHLALRIPSVYKLESHRNKPLLQDALSEFIPDFIARQPKRPFNPPIRHLVRQNLDSLEDHLCGPGSKLQSVMNRRFVQDQLARFRSGTRDNSTFLWGLATLESWLGMH